MTSRDWDDWSRRLEAGGSVDLTVGDNMVVRVQGDGVWLPSRDLLVRWQHLGFADGWEQPRFSGVPYRLELIVSRPWWAEQVAQKTGRAMEDVLSDLAGTHATVDVEFRSWRRRVPLESFAEWLTQQAEDRAPIPERLCITPVADGQVMDRDTNRSVALDRLPITHELRSRLVAWGQAGSSLARDNAADEAAWESLKPEGRKLARALEVETGRSSVTWWDTTDMP
ncbi:hypothetical protein [uncultured Nocardioides sp.]|uniref:hypothetical protein n=1 Tax=uncultured Nocardioides sp. TaxID=198441 RepID=UPI002606F406|nr:hypothetical protein [uncultured Nocardioides sp.]